MNCACGRPATVLLVFADDDGRTIETPACTTNLRAGDDLDGLVISEIIPIPGALPPLEVDAEEMRQVRPEMARYLA